ncbi:MAG: S9 family peptidase, partial [Dokdonia sp.]|nr:S9 family peptidase [Dokdonia sp.]
MNAIIKTIIVLGVAFCTGHLAAQDLNGAYAGTLDVQGMQLELIYNFTTTDEGLSATLDVPAQGATGIEMDSAVLDGTQLTVTSAKMKMSYLGTFENNTIKGTYTQMGQEYPLDLKATVKTKPGNTSLPTSDIDLAKLAAKEDGNFKYSVADYFKTPAAYSFKLSPDGKYLSYMKRRETGERDLFLKNTDTQEETLLVQQQEDLIRGYFWASEDRVLYLQDKGGNENYHLFGVDLDGSNNKELTPYDEVKVNLLAILKEDKEHVIVQMNKDNKEQEEPYKLNIITGDAEI